MPVTRQSYPSDETRRSETTPRYPRPTLTLNRAMKPAGPAQVNGMIGYARSGGSTRAANDPGMRGLTSQPARRDAADIVLLLSLVFGSGHQDTDGVCPGDAFLLKQ